MARAANQEICWPLQSKCLKGDGHSRGNAHIMEVHSVLHRKNSNGQKSSPIECGVMTPEEEKETELTGMGGRPQAFRKVCRADGRTRLRICDLR